MCTFEGFYCFYFHACHQTPLYAALRSDSRVFRGCRVRRAHPTLRTLAFAFTLTAAFTSTILLNKICKCAPQNLSLWFKTFGGFVEVPLFFLYVGASAFSAGIIVVLLPLYGNYVQIMGILIVFIFCGVLTANLYSDTTDFEKACTKVGIIKRGPGGGGRELVAGEAKEEPKNGVGSEAIYFVMMSTSSLTGVLLRSPLRTFRRFHILKV